MAIYAVDIKRQPNKQTLYFVLILLSIAGIIGSFLGHGTVAPEGTSLTIVAVLLAVSLLFQGIVIVLSAFIWPVTFIVLGLGILVALAGLTKKSTP